MGWSPGTASPARLQPSTALPFSSLTVEAPAVPAWEPTLSQAASASEAAAGLLARVSPVSRSALSTVSWSSSVGACSISVASRPSAATTAPDATQAARARRRGCRGVGEVVSREGLFSGMLKGAVGEAAGRREDRGGLRGAWDVCSRVGLWRRDAPRQKSAGSSAARGLSRRGLRTRGLWSTSAPSADKEASVHIGDGCMGRLRRTHLGEACRDAQGGGRERTMRASGAIWHT